MTTRITVRAVCLATLTEEWTLDVTDEQMADLREDKNVALDLINGHDDVFIAVENIRVENEQDREVVRFDVVESDYVTPKD